jgi:hypothetical protein
VQRLADVLVRDGLAAYEANPAHRRAKLLRITHQGRTALRTIQTAKAAWADALGAKIGDRPMSAPAASTSSPSTGSGTPCTHRSWPASRCRST